jgi:hypothetical protein
MTDPFVQALREWQNFYFMVGSASATLIGLMFVAVSLGADLPAATDATGINTFVMPMLVHFGSVVLIAAEMLIPTFRHLGLGIALLVTGIVFTAYSCWVAWQFNHHPGGADYTKSDWKWYVTFPIIGDLLIVVMALLLLLTGSLDSFDLLAVAAIFLVIISVRNTWDLMLWIAQSRQKTKTE